MKKLSILLLVGIFIIPTVSFASIDTNLKYGSRGTEVTELQEFLIDKGFLTGQTTGNFFTLTRKAVISYQTSVGLPSTGFVGPLTRTKINDGLSMDDTSSNTAEVAETGTTVPPTKNDAVTAMQKQIDTLLAQLQQLNSQVQTQTTVQQQTQTTLQQTQQSVQQIQQNTTPAPVPVIIPPIPNDNSDIMVKVIPPNYNGETFSVSIDGKFYSDPYNFQVSVLDRAGSYIRNAVVKMSMGGVDITEQSTNGLSGRDEKWIAGFQYKPTNSGSKTVSFTANGMTKSVQIDVPTPVVESDIEISDIENKDITIDRATSGWNISASGYGDSKFWDIGNFTYINPNERLNVYESLGVGGAHLSKMSEGNNCVSTDIQNHIVSVKLKPCSWSSNLTLGVFTVIVDKLILVGEISNMERKVNGLPVTFTYEVR